LVRTITIQLGTESAVFKLEKERLLDRKKAIEQVKTMREAAARLLLSRNPNNVPPLPPPPPPDVKYDIGDFDLESIISFGRDDMFWEADILNDEGENGFKTPENDRKIVSQLNAE
jgi:hypothetical protein